MRVACPMCGSKTRATHSALASPTFRQAYVQCTSPDCGWSGTAHLAIDRTINPGLKPRADVTLEVPREAADAFVRALLGIGADPQPDAQDKSAPQ